MQNFWIFLLLFILCLIVILTYFYFLCYLKSLIKSNVPYVSSFNRQLKILKKLKIEKWKKIVDLWCWNWKVLRFFENYFNLIWTWYDINLFAILYWKIINKIKKSDIKLIKADFLKQEIKQYDYIYLYLFPNFLEKIEDRIFENKNKDAIIISTAFKFKKNKPFKIINEKIYLYK